MSAPKTALYTTLSIFVLLVLAVGAGIGYIWYTGQQAPAGTAIQEPVAAPAAPKGPQARVPSPDAPVSASIQNLTTPVAPGDNASVSVRTTPTANCVIVVKYDDQQSSDSGLSPKAADEFGLLSWTWTVDEAAPLGTWPVEVTCVFGDKSAVVKGDLEVAQPES